MLKLSVCGVMRGGNHGVIRWLAGCVNEQTIFYNNVNVTAEKQYKKFYSDKPVGCEIRSYENVLPEECIKQEKQCLIILRDPFNWLASYLAHKDFHYSIMHVYFMFADHILSAHNNTFINYNEWFRNKKYRKKLAEGLGLSFSDRMLNSVSPFGGGSSFTGTEYDGKAQKMAVLERWRVYAKDEKYQHYLKEYPRLTKIGEEIFNFNPFKNK